MKIIINSIFKTFFLCITIIANVSTSYAQTASILPPAKTQLLDNNGKPLVSGTVDYYIPGTTTRKTTWQNSGQTVANTNPVVLDGGGRALMLGDGSYRQVVRDRLGNLIWDQITSSTGSGGGGTTATVGDGDAVGTIKPWGGLIAPAAYAFAYGQEFIRGSFPELFAALTSQQNVSCTLGSPTLTGLSSTEQLPIGANIESACVNAGTTIISKTISTVVVSSNAIVSTSTSVRFFPYGNGDGSSTFNAPDLRGRIIAGRDNMGGIAASRLTTAYFGNASAIGATGGSQSHTMTASESAILSYTNTVTDATYSVPNTYQYQGASATNTGGGIGGVDVAKPSLVTKVLGASVATATNAGGLAHSIVQPTETLNYIIKTLPDTNPNSYFGVASIGGMTGVILCGTGVTCSGNTISSVVSVTNITDSVTSYTGGSINGLIYNNSGIVKTIIPVNNGIAITNGSGVPSISTSLPSAITAPNLNLTGTASGTNVIPNSVLANMAANTIKGSIAGGSPIDLTAAQATSIINNFVGDSGAGGTKGLVPAPAAGDAAASKVLGASGGWVALSGGINLMAAPYNATCNGTTDDTTAIQAWLDAIPTLGPGYIPGGKTCIHTAQLYVKSNSVINGNFSTIKAANGSSSATTGIHMTDVTWAGTGPSNVIISNLIYDGNRANRTPPGQASGIYIINAANIKLENVTSKNCVADCVYAGQASAGPSSTNIMWDHVIAMNAYRNNGTIAGVQQMSVIGSNFNGANGTSPQAGLDIEPDNAGAGINAGVYVSNSSFDGNAGNGLNAICVIAAQCNLRSGANNVTASSNGGYGFLAASTSTNFRWCNINGTANTTAISSGVTDKCPP